MMFDAIKDALQTVPFPDTLPELYRERMYAWFAPRNPTDKVLSIPAIVLVGSRPDYVAGTEEQTYEVIGCREVHTLVLALYDTLVDAARAANVTPISGDRTSEVAGADSDVIKAELVVRGPYGCY